MGGCRIYTEEGGCMGGCRIHTEEGGCMGECRIYTEEGGCMGGCRTHPPSLVGSVCGVGCVWGGVGWGGWRVFCGMCRCPLWI